MQTKEEIAIEAALGMVRVMADHNEAAEGLLLKACLIQKRSTLADQARQLASKIEANTPKRPPSLWERIFGRRARYASCQLAEKSRLLDAESSEVMRLQGELAEARGEIERLKAGSKVIQDQRDKLLEVSKYMKLQAESMRPVVEAALGVSDAVKRINTVNQEWAARWEVPKVQAAQKKQDEAVAAYLATDTRKHESKGNPWAPNQDYPGKPVEDLLGECRECNRLVRDCGNHGPMPTRP